MREGVGRLSAVIGRPGWSNSISYPYTGIFTQPLEGKDYDVPLPMDVRSVGVRIDVDAAADVMSLRVQRPYPCSALNTNVLGLLFIASKVDGAALGHNRVIQLPAKRCVRGRRDPETRDQAFSLLVMAARACRPGCGLLWFLHGQTRSKRRQPVRMLTCPSAAAGP